MLQGTLNSTITSYQPVLIASQDYYPFGMQMDSRGTNAISGSTQYRFGFNGQEKDNEIYGEDNATTALFWEYDARIGRRWNVDPVVKPWESSYSCFNSNPVIYADPKGLDGVATVDKEKKTIMVNMTVHYSNENTKKDGLLGDYGLTLDDVKNDFKEYYGGERKTSIDGVEYTVTFNISWEEHETDKERDEATKNDGLANKLVISDEMNAGSWAGNTRTLKFNPAGQRRGTFSHEISHGLGFKDTSPTSSYEKDVLTGNTVETNGPINSYAMNRTVDDSIVNEVARRSVDAANQVVDKTVRVWLPGVKKVKDAQGKVQYIDRPATVIK